MTRSRSFAAALVAGSCILVVVTDSRATAAEPGILQGPREILLGQIHRVVRCEKSLASEIYTRFNTPSSCCQCLGFGVGAGYHAMQVYGPACSWHNSQQGVHWLPASPAPSCPCAGLEMAPAIYAPRYVQPDYCSPAEYSSPSSRGGLFAPPPLLSPDDGQRPQMHQRQDKGADPEPLSPSDVTWSGGVAPPPTL